MRFASRITFSGEGLMMRTQSAVEREVKVSFEPDRLAQESLARAYARLVADPVRAQRARPWPQRRLLAHTGRDQRVQEVER